MFPSPSFSQLSSEFSQMCRVAGRQRSDCGCLTHAHVRHVESEAEDEP
jgi:hypothetical protein